jgi:hypothetical protein
MFLAFLITGLVSIQKYKEAEKEIKEREKEIEAHERKENEELEN